MQQEIEALLALQEDDLKIREIEAQITALDPQLVEFDKKRDQVLASLAKAEIAVAAEEKKQRELQARLAQHQQMQERNLHQLDDVKRMREATAATAQVESTRRLMAEDETEIAILGRRIAEMNAAIAVSRQSLAAIEAEQNAARRAGAVARPMLGKYDRIRGKRTRALYPLQGGSCGNCDTAVPLQRRNMMAGSGQIEVCEACGVLLYAEGT